MTVRGGRYHTKTWLCPACSTSNFPDRIHCFGCRAPRPEPTITRTGICGKRTVRNGYRALCVMEAGHKGACT